MEAPGQRLPMRVRASRKEGRSGWQSSGYRSQTHRRCFRSCLAPWEGRGAREVVSPWDGARWGILLTRSPSPDMLGGLRVTNWQVGP